MSIGRMEQYSYSLMLSYSGLMTDWVLLSDLLHYNKPNLMVPTMFIGLSCEV